MPIVLNLVVSLFGVLIGGLITWFVAKHYYERASIELSNEASGLRGLTIMVLRALEVAKFVKFNKDEQGNPVGFVFEVKPVNAVHHHRAEEVKPEKAEA